MCKQSVRTLFYLLFLLSLSLSIQAQRKPPEYIFPSIPFDEAAATQMLDDGTNTLRGKSWITRKGRNFFPSRNDKILLFPVTPYLTEFLELRKKNTKKKQAAMAADAFMYRIEGKYTDFEGTFEFKNIKPGKYYAITWITYEKTKNVSIKTGTSTSYNIYGAPLSSWPIYEDFDYHYDVDAEVTQFIEVTGEKQVLNLSISVKKK